MTRPAPAIPVPTNSVPAPEPGDTPATLELVHVAVPHKKAAQILGGASKGVRQSILVAAHGISTVLSDIVHRTRRLADERPLHFVGGVAAVSLLAGVGLRIWRSSRYDRK
jgi:hypothetical protein